MPLDSTNWPLPVVKTGPEPVLREGLAGLAQLSEALRHPEWWPSWRWDYSDVSNEPSYTGCATSGCALGLARTIWNRQDRAYGSFGLRASEYAALFHKGPESYGVPHERVTEVMVADAIDRLLAEKGFEG